MSLDIDPNHVFRDFVTDGIPASGAHDPKKVEIREWATGMWQAVLGLVAGANPGVTLPNLLIRYTITGGTANAIQASPNLMPPAGPGLALFSIAITQENTGPVTINGKPLRTNGGEAIAAGEILPNDMLLFLDNGDHFRLLMDTGSLRNKLAAEAAQAAAEIDADRAEAARDVAAGYVSDIVSQGNVPIYATVAGMAALEVPAGISAIRLNGFGATGDMGEGALYTDVDNGTPPVFESGGDTARSWYLAKGQNDVRMLGAGTMEDATPAFVSMRDRLGKGEWIEAGESVIGGLQLSDQNIRAQKLKAAPGASEVLKLGYRTPGWDYRKVSGFFEGNDDHTDLDNAPNGLVYSADVSTEYAGRWAIENAFLWYFDKAIVAPNGNIGNTYDHVSVLHCNYGFYAEANQGSVNGGTGDMMQPGCQMFGPGEWAATYIAAFYINGGPQGANVSNGQVAWDYTVIETNYKFGVVVIDYSQAWTPLSFHQAWIEHNALDKTPTELPDGSVHIPRDVLLKRVEHAVFSETPIWDVEFIDSAVLIDKSRLSNVTKIANSGSIVRATNVHTFGLADQPVMVESYTNAAIRAGGYADRVWMMPRLNRVYHPPFRGAVGIAASHSDPGGGTFAGGVSWTSVPYGMAYQNCAEFTIPAGGVAVIGDFSAAPGEVIVYSVDAMLLAGAVPNMSFTGNGTLCGNLAPLLRDQNEWYTVGGIARAVDGLDSIGLYIIAPAGQSVTMRLGVVQAMKFGTMAGAVHYFNANCYVHSDT